MAGRLSHGHLVHEDSTSHANQGRRSGRRWLFRGWMGSIRLRYRYYGPNVDPRRPGLSSRHIYAIWHENLLYPVHLFRNANVCYLISQHADGQILAEMARQFGVRLIRGSSTRGGEGALRQMIEAMREHHIGITPDGPQGPRRIVQPGLVFLASQTGHSIVPTGLAYRRAWRLSSWDRMAVPWPCTQATFVTGEPVSVPYGINRPALNEYRAIVQRGMDKVTALAENLMEEVDCQKKRAA